MAENAKIALTGRLTREPNQRTYNNSTVVSFSMAVNTTKKDEKDEYVADFYNVSVWGKPAEFILPRIQKGSLVQVYGSLQLGEFNDKKTGEKRPSLNVRATDVIPLTGNKPVEKKDEEEPF